MSDDRTFDLPKDRHYDRTRHLWARRDSDSGRVRVGIDAIGLDSLGELAYVALQQVGAKVARGGSVGSLEAAKMTTNIEAPVGGTITARNDAVLADPMVVNGDPYGAGWFIEIEPSSWQADSTELVSGDAITEWVAAERARLEADAID